MSTTLAPLQRIAAAIETCGLSLALDAFPLTDLDDLAQRVETAARNYSAGRKRRQREPEEPDRSMPTHAEVRTYTGGGDW